ncbi:src kinase-associated phosphoprotein 1 isoform X1 [Pleurodeles waltl]|uniref:src kinase-associated phosphoprotein 1 isoform X1 n=1 Tax=Pleurodeles waltl TaxID=8319 RepID=UPI00370985E7
MQAPAIPEEVLRLLQDIETFLVEFLQNEELSERGWQRRDALLLGFRQLKTRYSSEFPSRGTEAADAYLIQNGCDDNHSLHNAVSMVSDDVSFTSDFQDDDWEEIAPKAAQELEYVVQQGYLDKKCRDHSFFGSEWQKRWCVISKGIFYYYGSDKGKQQKGAFHLKDYALRIAPHLRKDSRRDSCFELVSYDKRTYQFTAASPVEAKEWMDHISFLLKDLNSSTIPCEDEEEKTYDDVDSFGSIPQPHDKAARYLAGSVEEDEPVTDEDIYEVLPDEDFAPVEDKDEAGDAAYDYSSYYQGLWDCHGAYTDELSFQRGDLIRILSKEYNNHGWWIGELHGEIGIVPKEYLMAAYELEIM